MYSDFYAEKIELVNPHLIQSSCSSPGEDFEPVSYWLNINLAFAPKVLGKVEQA